MQSRELSRLWEPPGVGLRWGGRGLCKFSLINSSGGPCRQAQGWELPPLAPLLHWAHELLPQGLGTAGTERGSHGSWRPSNGSGWLALPF